MKIFFAIAILVFLPLSLFAQTEVAPPPEELVPRQESADQEDVDDKSRKAADDALSNFRNRAEDQGVDVEGLEEQARGAMEDAGITEQDVEEVGRRIRDAARDAGVTDNDVEQVTGAVNERLDRAEQGEPVATEDEVEAALKALEELGAQAERALEEDEESLVIDDMATQNAASEAVDSNAEPALPATDDDILSDTEGASDPGEYPSISDSGDPAQRAMELAENIMGEDEIREIEQRRQQMFKEVNKKRNAKRAKITFSKAMTKASMDPEIAVLKEYAAQAQTESEKRSYLRQYYVELFKKIRVLEPDIAPYIDEREEEYLNRIDRVERGNDPAPENIPAAQAL